MIRRDFLKFAGGFVATFPIIKSTNVLASPNHIHSPKSTDDNLTITSVKIEITYNMENIMELGMLKPIEDVKNSKTIATIEYSNNIEVVKTEGWECEYPRWIHNRKKVLNSYSRLDNNFVKIVKNMLYLKISNHSPQYFETILKRKIVDIP